MSASMFPLNSLPLRCGRFNSILYDPRNGGDGSAGDGDDGDAVAVLSSIKDSLSVTTKSISTIREGVDLANKSSEENGTRITEVEKSVSKIIHDLETTSKSLDTHVEMVRSALKSLPAGKSSGLLGNSPYRTSSNDRFSVTFPNMDACAAFGLFTMGRCAGNDVARKRVSDYLESRKDEPFYGSAFKAMASGVFTSGGALVPQDFLNDLIRNIEEHGVFERNAGPVPMSSRTIEIPKRTGGLTVTYPDENVAIAEGDPATGDVMLTARLYATLTKWSNELIEDMAVDWGAWIAEEIVDAHAVARDTNGFTGDGSSTFARVTGVLNQSDVVTHILGNNLGASLTNTGKTSFSDTVYTDLAYMQGLIPTWARRNAKWYMHRHILAILKGIVTTAGDPVVLDRDTSLGRIQTLLGDPIEEVDVLPAASADAATTDFFCYGDLRRAFGFGKRRELRIVNSQEAGFAADQTWVRSTARVAIAALDGTAMVKARTSTT